MCSKPQTYTTCQHPIERNAIDIIFVGMGGGSIHVPPAIVALYQVCGGKAFKITNGDFEWTDCTHRRIYPTGNITVSATYNTIWEMTYTPPSTTELQPPSSSPPQPERLSFRHVDTYLNLAILRGSDGQLYTMGVGRLVNVYTSSVPGADGLITISPRGVDKFEGSLREQYNIYQKQQRGTRNTP